MTHQGSSTNYDRLVLKGPPSPPSGTNRIGAKEVRDFQADLASSKARRG